MSWILLTLLAAFSQSWRNAFQSRLSQTFSTVAVTLARFLWAGPLALLYLIGLYQWRPVALPQFSLVSAFFIVAAALMQIVATALMVVLFKQKNYAIGAGLAKSEAPMSAFLGVLFFGTSLSLIGWLGVLIGGLAVFVLSTAQGIKQLSLKTVLLGLACSTAFALTSLWIREASLSLALPFPYSAAWVLLLVIAVQTLLLVGYLVCNDRRSLVMMFKKPTYVVLTSLASFIGSFGWFSAMSLQAVPYVKTLGQIEVLFTMLISYFWLKESIKSKDVIALFMVGIAAILVMLH
ncbi:DMT family transporter [Reinekea thalattae]|uniref:DMT family transporter n=1 Tax=Reinekea thalattae TaxID=2593301 RepID=A0A5C8Z6W8_9GAMM|nr:DMT family transporter [Reinekea thalattae]TXR53034.1 DMT family transporter [Reinekea thalattae]